MANYLTTDTDLTAVADAIRTKGGTSAALEFPTDFVSAIQAISGGGGGGTGFGVKGAGTPAGLIYALENNDYHSGLVTVTDYFPANTESEFCDTGYGETDLFIYIFDTLARPYETGTEGLFFNLGQFNAPEESGADFSVAGAYPILRYRGSTIANFFGNRMKSYRVNGGKLYFTPAYAQTNYTYFRKGHTYRWIAFPAALT